MRIYPRALLLSLVLPLAVAAAAPAGVKAKPRLRFDGMYQEYPPVIDSSDEEHRWYLRFYEDGTVVQKESISAPEKWTSRLERENEKLGKGAYKLAGDRLTYKLDEQGDSYTVSYSAEGLVLPGGKLKITMSVRGTYSGHQSKERTLAFMKIPPPKK